MPDWFYRTVSRPLLFRLPTGLARDTSLGLMGTLSKLPFGGAVIDLLGHMRAPQRLQRQVIGLRFPAPIGLGPHLDVEAKALQALARFGFGFLEVGPVTVKPVTETSPPERLIEAQALRLRSPLPNPGLEVMARRLAGAGPLPAPLLVRIGGFPAATIAEATAQTTEIIERLSPYAAAFTLATTCHVPAIREGPEQWRAHLDAVVAACRRAPIPRRLLLCIPADLSAADFDVVINPALDAGSDGILIDGSISPNGNAGGERLIGRPAQAAACRLTRQLRDRYGANLTIIAAGGVHQPADALALMAAGADLIQTDTGLIYSGPGLPKRINETLLHRELLAPAAGSKDAGGEDAERAVEMSWFWTALLGLGMLVGSLLALLIAATRVVLPYDEAFVGLTRAQLQAINPRLLPFMSHDRVSLAGTMITIAVLYLGLSYGVRRGWHWALHSILYSAFSGFLSFFLFLGFDYFDPFHAFVTAILFQIFLLAVHSRLGAMRAWPKPSLDEDWRWRWSQWGQLLFVIHGVGLLAAGTIIAGVGVTGVFVAEDLEFMQTTAATFEAVTHRLVPLIAHDRATFGGMLIASGLGVLLPALWGFRQGESWLWWTFCLAGPPAYLSTIGVHLFVGYTNLWHLAPVFTAFALYAAGLLLSRPYLCGSKSAGKVD